MARYRNERAALDNVMCATLSFPAPPLAHSAEPAVPAPPRPPDAIPGPAAIIVLGADAFLAALPATPAQLVEACLAAGFAAAVPASWGTRWSRARH